MWNFNRIELVIVDEKMDKFQDFEIHSQPDFQENLAEERLWMLKMLIAVLKKDAK